MPSQCRSEDLGRSRYVTKRRNLEEKSQSLCSNVRSSCYVLFGVIIFVLETRGAAGHGLIDNNKGERGSLADQEKR